MKTLNPYIEKLKPIQQEYIVYCVKQYGDRPDFHRGLLPFLSVNEADRCLRLVLIDPVQHPGVDEIRKGIRFINGIRDVFIDAVEPAYTYPDYTHVDMGLNSVKLIKKYRKQRNSQQFNIKVPLASKAVLVQMKFLRSKNWRVTAPRSSISQVTTWLAEHCR